MVRASGASTEGRAGSDGEAKTRAYYDDFARGYEDRRSPKEPEGYHALIDDLETELVRRYGDGKDVLECGCGTGLLLQRFARFARSAEGVDLSPGMLEKARARGLDVQVGSVTELPFDDGAFDVTCSFKVLAHVPEIGRALSEMTRVTRAGGIVLAELYNPISLRWLAKRLAPAGRVSASRVESDVYTRFDAPWIVPRLVPPGARLVAVRGVRIVTPTAGSLRWPLVGPLLRRLEVALADTPAAFFGGFYVAVLQKRA